MAAYQADICVVADRPAGNRGHENQSIRHRTNRAATKRSTNAGHRHAVPVCVYPHSDPGWSGLSDLNSREAELVCSTHWRRHRDESLKHELLDSPAILDF